MSRADDVRFMTRAIELAGKGAGSVEPNPRVGAVVVKGGRVIGEGWHRRFGGPHAEVEALSKLGARAKGSTLYVNLEPCAHHGKTPPCTELLIRSGVREVVAALRDPNPAVDGLGFRILKKVGIAVRTGVLADEAERVNRGFLKVHRTGLPYVAAKWAMTLDGKIATAGGDSRWISGERSRRLVRALRDEFQAILVGANTALRDDPRLRGAETKPVRIVLDSKARLPLTARLATTARRQRTIVAVTPGADESQVRKLWRAGIEIITLEEIDLLILFEELARAGIQSILVEGGGEVHASCLSQGLVDEVVVFVGPKIVGGRDAKTPVEGDGLQRMRDALELEDVRVERIGDDAVIRGRVPS